MHVTCLKSKTTTWSRSFKSMRALRQAGHHEWIAPSETSPSHSRPCHRAAELTSTLFKRKDLLSHRAIVNTAVRKVSIEILVRDLSSLPRMSRARAVLWMLERPQDLAQVINSAQSARNPVTLQLYQFLRWAAGNDACTPKDSKCSTTNTWSLRRKWRCKAWRIG